LRKYVQSPKRRILTTTAEKMATLSIYVEKLHIKEHVVPWCLENCDPRKVDDLEGVCKCCCIGITIYVCNLAAFKEAFCMAYTV